jgi:hypothetical protein
MFDPTVINKEQEANKDMLDMAKNLLTMCKSLRTNIRQNIACQNNKRVIRVGSDFDSNMSIVEDGKNRLKELHSINVY